MVWFKVIIWFYRPSEWLETINEKEAPLVNTEGAESEEEDSEDSDFSLGGNPNRRRLYVESDDDEEDD